MAEKTTLQYGWQEKHVIWLKRLLWDMAEKTTWLRQQSCSIVGKTNLHYGWEGDLALWLRRQLINVAEKTTLQYGWEVDLALWLRRRPCIMAASDLCTGGGGGLCDGEGGDGAHWGRHLGVLLPLLENTQSGFSAVQCRLQCTVQCTVQCAVSAGQCSAVQRSVVCCNI